MNSGKEKTVRIVFVCTGNICRSPTAEGVARALAERRGLGGRFHFESAGTHGYHVGEPPDGRTVAAARRRGYDLSGQRARRIGHDDFVRFDRVLALDQGHLALLKAACPPDLLGKLGLFLDYSPRFRGQDVPDPYYGGAQGFEDVLDRVEDAVEGLLRHYGGTAPAVD